MATSVASRTGSALQPNLFRIDRFVGLKIVDGAAHAPSPSLQHAPIVWFPRLAFIHEPDDALGQARSVVRLVARGTSSA